LIDAWKELINVGVCNVHTLVFGVARLLTGHC